MRNEGEESTDASIVMTGIKVVVALIVMASLTFGLLIGYGHFFVDETQPPEFEQTDELRFEVANDWEDPGPSDEYDSGEIESLVVEFTNEERSAEGLPELESTDKFVDVARGHSEDMASNGYVGHVDSQGRNPGDRISCDGGENAGATFYEYPIHDDRSNETITNENERDIARSLVDDWMASPPHRENILTEEYDTISLGVYVSEGKAVFATQLFCAQ